MPLALSNRLKSRGFRGCSCTDLQLLKGVWECHKRCPKIITFLQKMREKRHSEVEGLQSAEAEWGWSTKLWLLDSPQQKRILYFLRYRTVFLAHRNTPARKMKCCCFRVR